MSVRISRRGRVRCTAVLPLEMPVGRAWGQLRDFHRYASHDHFHAGIAIAGGVPCAGAKLEIDHRYGPFRVRRVGRILRWREEEGFAFSDLSQLGPRRGFPHILQLKLAAESADRCELHLAVTGLWTAPVPHWLAKWWLRWVFASVTQRVRNDLLAFQIVLTAKQRRTARR